MPTTANFSLEYPDDNSSVDIAGHFETLADDVDAAINTRLALTGGTLTGSLSGTSLSLSSTLSVAGTTTFTGNVVSNVTIAKASPTLMVSASSGESRLDISGTAASNRALRFRTAGVARWTMFGADGTAESGANAGSNFILASYDDAGSYISSPLTITRSTGAVTLTGDLTLSKSDARLTVDSTANDGYANIQALANKYAGVIVRTGSSPRWGIVKSNYGESGSNVGSDLLITGYSDAGSSLGNWLTIERANGKVTLNGALALSGSQHTIKNGTPTTLNFAKGSQWGYSSGYRAIILGDTAGSPNNVTVAIGYDPVGNANGSFTGNGSEVLFRNAVEFTTPNAANNAWLKPLKFDSSGNTTLLGLTAGTTTLTGDLVISKASPVINMSGSGAAVAKFSSTSATSEIRLNSAAGNGAYLNYMTADSARWAIWKTNDAESGSNAGSNLEIHRYSDAGAALGAALTITRSTGAFTLTGDVTISKASPILSVSASTTTTASIYFDNAAAGSYGRFLFRVNGSKRWECGRDGTAEAGANAGSDFYISNYSDASAAIGIPFKIARSTGKTTLGYVGATAGLELGTSGPRVMSGTGSPEGVVTAPVGSRWIRADGDTLGDFEYQKRSGTGNTGWVVAEGDTGSRNMSAVSLDNGWTVASSVFLLRRIGATVQVTVGVNKTSATADTFYTLPVGFRPAIHTYGTSSSATDDYANATFTTGGGLAVSRAYMNVAAHYLAVTFVTGDAWPTSLPGSAA